MTPPEALSRDSGDPHPAVTLASPRERESVLQKPPGKLPECKVPPSARHGGSARSGDAAQQHPPRSHRRHGAIAGGGKASGPCTPIKRVTISHVWRRLAGSVSREVTLDLTVVSLSPTFGGVTALKIKS